MLSSPVRQFYETFVGHLPDPSLAMDLFEEEDEEFHEAVEALLNAVEMDDLDVVPELRRQVLKEGLDLIFVTVGYLLAAGYNVDEGWLRVCSSNMTKQRTPEGKVQKGPKYVPPHLDDLV